MRRIEVQTTRSRARGNSRCAGSSPESRGIPAEIRQCEITQARFSGERTCCENCCDVFPGFLSFRSPKRRACPSRISSQSWMSVIRAAVGTERVTRVRVPVYPQAAYIHVPKHQGPRTINDGDWLFVVVAFFTKDFHVFTYIHTI